MTTPSNTFFLVLNMLQALPTGLRYWQFIDRLNQRFFMAPTGHTPDATESPQPCCELGSLDDRTLIQKYQQTDEATYMGELYKRYAHLVLGTCIKYLKDEERAQDAVSEIFTKLIVKLRNFHPNYFAGWLYKVARNHCLEVLRKDQSAPAVERFDVLQEPQFPSERGEPEYLHRELVASELGTAIGKLPERQRVTIELFYLRGLSYKQVAARTGFSMKAVKSYVQNGKRNLRKYLANAASEYGWKKSI